MQRVVQCVGACEGPRRVGLRGCAPGRLASSTLGYATNHSPSSMLVCDVQTASDTCKAASWRLMYMVVSGLMGAARSGITGRCGWM